MYLGSIQTTMTSLFAKFYRILKLLKTYHPKVFSKKDNIENSANSQENACVGASL